MTFIYEFDMHILFDTYIPADQP